MLNSSAAQHNISFNVSFILFIFRFYSTLISLYLFSLKFSIVNCLQVITHDSHLKPVVKQPCNTTPAPKIQAPPSLGTTEFQDKCKFQIVTDQHLVKLIIR